MTRSSSMNAFVLIVTAIGWPERSSSTSGIHGYMKVSPPISVMCSANGLTWSKNATKSSKGRMSRGWLNAGTHMMQRWLHGIAKCTP